jgi:hypothetical protein
LDEAEVATFQNFAVAEEGRFGSFTFADPWDGTTYPNCSLASERLDPAYGYGEPLIQL